MGRIKKNLTLDQTFAEWLEYWQEKTGAPPSRVMEIATIEKYQAEFDEFKKNYYGNLKGNGSDKP